MNVYKFLYWSWDNDKLYGIPVISMNLSLTLVIFFFLLINWFHIELFNVDFLEISEHFKDFQFDQRLSGRKWVWTVTVISPSWTITAKGRFKFSLFFIRFSLFSPQFSRLNILETYHKNDSMKIEVSEKPHKDEDYDPYAHRKVEHPIS